MRVRALTAGLPARLRRLACAIVLVLLTASVLALPVTADGPSRVSGGGGTLITSFILSDNSITELDEPIRTRFGFVATAEATGDVKGQFQCLINGPGFTGNVMNLHGDVRWLTIAGSIASFGGDSNFGPYSVEIDTSGPQPTLILIWTEPFGPGLIGTIDIITHGNVQISP